MSFVSDDESDAEEHETNNDDIAVSARTEMPRRDVLGIVLIMSRYPL